MEHQMSERSILVHLFYRYYNMALETDIPWTINADKCSREHIMTLCAEGQNNILEYPVGKMNRWIGFVQALLIAQGFTTVDAERDYTRQLFQLESDTFLKSYP